MGIVDAVCSVVGCGKVIKWQSGDPMRCAEHGGVSYRNKAQHISVSLPLASTHIENRNNEIVMEQMLDSQIARSRRTN